MKLRLEPEYLASVTIAIASLFIASVSVGFPTPKFLLLFGASYVSLHVLFMLLMGWGGKSFEGSRKTWSRDKVAIYSLTLDEAKSQALAALSDRDRFAVVPRLGEGMKGLSDLGPELREFFERYEAVEMRHGDLKLSRSEIRPSAMHKNFVRVGTDTGDAEVLSLPRVDSVFVIGSTETLGAAEQYPSIYHLLVMCSRLVRHEE